MGSGQFKREVGRAPGLIKARTQRALCRRGLMCATLRWQADIDEAFRRISVSKGTGGHAEWPSCTRAFSVGIAWA